MVKKSSCIVDAVLENIKPIKSSEIRKIRLRAKLNQAAFARHFNRKRGFIAQLERGIRQPRGSTLVLLNVIRRKGFEAIL